MKAFLSGNLAALLAGTITLALGTGFWFCFDSKSEIGTGYAKLDGKILTFQTDRLQTRENASPQFRSEPLTTPHTTPFDPKLMSRRTRRKTKKKTATLDATASAPTIKTQEDHSTTPDATEVSMGYRLQKTADDFEADASKYPLERRAAREGITLNLRSLARREEMFVLKLAVSNQTDANFFIKEFTAQAGSSPLGSRFLFRLLVESQRTREGYVFFDKPHAGASVKIVLKEDGGKGRTVIVAIPYPF